jgi:hypothetical protein
LDGGSSPFLSRLRIADTHDARIRIEVGAVAVGANDEEIRSDRATIIPTSSDKGGSPRGQGSFADQTRVSSERTSL